MKRFFSDSNHKGGIAPTVCAQKLEPTDLRSSFAGEITRLVTAPIGSETMSATAEAVFFTQLIDEDTDPLKRSQMPPLAKATWPRLVPVSPTLARPLPREALTRSSQGLPPRARSESGRMIPSPPDRRREPPPSGEKKWNTSLPGVYPGVMVRHWPPEAYPGIVLTLGRRKDRPTFSAIVSKAFLMPSR